MNILVTSAGRRVKVIQYFRNAFRNIGKVIAADCDYKASALYFADEFELIPRIDNENYIQEVINVCKGHKVNAIVSLLDPELEVLAKHKDIFTENEVQLILSPHEMVDMSFDKQKTHDHLSKLEIPVVPTFSGKDSFIETIENGEYNYPAIVKPGKGSASLGLFEVNNENELNNIFRENEGLIIQPFYRDMEFGIDVYIDIISGELVDVFIKEKLLMRSGETDKSISIHNDKIEKLVIELIDKTNFRGPVDIDCFEFNGEYYISEVNPRFGGGYPHAYELGCDFMTYIANNLKGKSNKVYETFSYEKGLIMVKYDDVKIING